MARKATETALAAPPTTVDMYRIEAKLTKAQRRRVNEERERADSKEWWDRVERFGMEAMRTLTREPVLRAIVGAIGGAVAFQPTDINVRQVNVTYRAHSNTNLWYWEVDIVILAFSVLPNIDIGSPIPGGGNIPIHVRDWFSLPQQVFRFYDPRGDNFENRAYMYDKVLWPAVRQRCLLFGLGGGALALTALPAVVSGASKGIKGFAEFVDHLVPG
jgi:hypothetical protein